MVTTKDENILKIEASGLSSTFTDDLIRFRDWLLIHNCPIVMINHKELLERLKEVPGISDISARDIKALSITKTG